MVKIFRLRKQELSLHRSSSLYFFVLCPGSMTGLFQAGSRSLFQAGAFEASIVFAVTFLIPERTGGAATGFLLLVTGQVLASALSLRMAGLAR